MYVYFCLLKKSSQNQENNGNLSSYDIHYEGGNFHNSYYDVYTVNSYLKDEGIFLINDFKQGEKCKQIKERGNQKVA